MGKPWLHFVLLGAILYQLQSAFFPEPLPVIGPLSDARVSAIKKEWQLTTGAPPGPDQTQKLIALELDQDMLMHQALELGFHLTDGIVFQRLVLDMKFLQLAEGESDTELFAQALQMGLHLDDEVVKRRLIQLAEQYLLASYPPKPLTQEVLRSEYERRRETLIQPAVYSFQHLFFGPGREDDLSQVIAQISTSDLSFSAAKSLGSPFIQGHQFEHQNAQRLSYVFGQAFTENLEQAMSKVDFSGAGWIGPVQSTFGWHYIYLTGYQPAAAARFEDVEKRLRDGLEYRARGEALEAAMADLRASYEIRGQVDSSGRGQQ